MIRRAFQTAALGAVAILTFAPAAPAAPSVSRTTVAAPMEAGGIIVPDSKLELVFDQGFFLEGPSQGPDGRIYFSDITQSWRTAMAAGHIWVNDPKTGATKIFRSPSGMANGLLFDAEGRMIAAHGADFGGRYVTRTEKDGRAFILAGLYNGRPFNAPNDVDIDAKGRVYFSDPRYFGFEAIDQPLAGVYRIDRDGKVSLLLADVSRPNGVAVSPDQKTLYVAEADYLIADRRIDPAALQRFGEMRIMQYDLSEAGVPGNPRVFVDYGLEGGGSADGLEVDSQGNLYAAVQTKRPGVRVYNAQGKEIAFVGTPDKPTNLTLAHIGQQYWLYITAGKALYRIETRVAPRHYAVAAKGRSTP